MAQKDVDEQFAAIMAHWDEVALGRDPYGDTLGDREPGPEHGSDADRDPGTAEPAESGLPAPTREDVRPERQTEIHAVREVSDLPELADPADRADPREDPEPQPRAGWRQSARPVDEEDGLGEDDEHYQPPPPAPLPPSEDKHFWLMVVALVSGPLLFLYLLLFNRDGNGWWMMFALLVSIAGFVLLVLRQPMERDEDDDGIRL